MLAPVSEALFGEDALLRLNLLAVRRFPAFAAELEEVTGQQVGLRREGTLAVAHDPGDHAALLRLVAFRRSLGLDAEELDGRECRALEPFLAPDVRGGALFAGDWSVDNRRYVAALRQAAAAAGARTVRGRVTRVLARGGRACGVERPVTPRRRPGHDQLRHGRGRGRVLVRGDRAGCRSRWRPRSARSRASCCGCGGPPGCLPCSAARCAPPCAGPRSTWCRGRTAS